MTPLQSKINELQARLEQFKTSELFSEAEKNKRIAETQAELDAIIDKASKDIEVNNPEIL